MAPRPKARLLGETRWGMKLVYGYQRWGGTTPVPTNADIDRWQQKRDAAILRAEHKRITAKKYYSIGV